MTAVPGEAHAGGGGEAGGLERAHAALRADPDVQFDLPAAPEPPPPPAWLKMLGEWFSAMAPYMEWVFWGVLALAVLAIAFFIGREVVRTRFPGRHRPAVLTQADSWRPNEAQARVLLADADALAAQGRYAEAAHLLLRRSVQDIQVSRPRLVRPALTSRDIARHEGLPATARDTFAAIASIVERSLFGGRGLDVADWTGAREAYARFALPEVLA